MLEGLKNNYELISPKEEINDFIDSNEDTFKILNALEPHLEQKGMILNVRY